MLLKKLEHLNPAEDPFHDFRNFAFHIMHDVLSLGDPHEIQYEIANWMQDFDTSADGIVRKMIQAMRGAGKSVIACIFICWLWYCNPSIRVVILSSISTKANELSGLVKQILDSADILAHLRPDPDAVELHRGKRVRRLKKEKNTENIFDVRGAGPGKDPSFAAYPVFGGWTGSHPDIIIPDDTEIPENSLTALKRERLYDKLRECESLIMEGGMIMYMGTPQTEESIYGKLEEAGYRLRKYPAELVDPDDEARSRNVAEFLLEKVRSGQGKVGDPSYPERFPRERLLEKKAKGLAYYNLQMLLDTTLSDQERYPLKLRNLIVFDTPVDMAPTNIVWGTAQRLSHLECPGFSGDYLHAPGFVEDSWAKFQQKVMYIDPKGGGADTVGWAVGGFLNGVIYTLGAGGLAAGEDGTADAVMIQLARLAGKYEVDQILVESNWGGSKDTSTYARLLQPHVSKWCGPVSIETRHVSGRKEVRILDTLEPVVNGHRLVLSESAASCRELLYQFTHITREPGALGHDDELDALYGMVSHFAGLVSLDPEQREVERREREAIETAQEFDRWSSRNPLVAASDRPWKNIRQRDSGRYNARGRWRRL